MLVENTKPKIVHIAEGLIVKPGVNFVADAAWRTFAASRFGQGKIDEGTMKVIEAPQAAGGSDKAPDASSALAAYDDKGAIKIVESTLDRSLLETWSTIDQRKSVLKAIDKQMEKLKPDLTAAKE